MYNFEKIHDKKISYKKGITKETINSEENANLVPIELARKYNTDIGNIKRYKTEFVDRHYTNEEIKQKIEDYGFDLNGKCLVRQIKWNDIGLYNSIIRNTNNHYLHGNTVVERLYRIMNDYEPDYIERCSNCKKTPLIFVRYTAGYGESDYKLCGNCNNVLNGVSKISQKLFKQIYDKLHDKSNCFFHDLNHEKTIKIDKNYIRDEFLNKNHYKLDFCQNNKIIEFDGRFYHKEIEREISKDKFLNYKGYLVLHISDVDYMNDPQLVLEKCLTFLQN